MQILIIRHADPNYAIDDLTQEGHLEAAALGQKIKNAGLDELYASPLGRAQTTAKYISEQTNLPIQTLDWTRELQGWVSSLPNGEKVASWDYPGEFIDDRKKDLLKWKRDEDYWLKDTDKLKKYNKMITDSDQFLEDQGLVRQGGTYEIIDPSAERKKIAIVCHGGFGLFWLSHLLHMPLSFVWQSFWLPTSSVTTVLFEKRNTNIVVPRCIRMSDVAHLEEANLPVSKSGLRATNY